MPQKTPEDFLFKHVSGGITNLADFVDAMEDFADYKLELAKGKLYKSYLDTERLGKVLLSIEDLKSGKFYKHPSAQNNIDLAEQLGIIYNRATAEKSIDNPDFAFHIRALQNILFAKNHENRSR